MFGFRAEKSTGEMMRCDKCNQYKPDRCTCDLVIGGKYNWKNQPERLVYMGVGTGISFGWHQFALVEKPNKVWCEVLNSDMHLLEKTKST